MPLSPSDVVFINKLLDQHLKAQRAWPWSRYCLLISGVVLLLTAIMECYAASIMDGLVDNIMPASTRPVPPTATNPVTQVQFLNSMQSSEEMMKAYAKFVARIDAECAGLYMTSIVLFAVAAVIIIFTLAKWNRHRRDTILITLLREKFAAELTPITPSPATT